MVTSASGARIQGDDYQHLFSWYQALELALPDSDATSVAVEVNDAGFVDDVVVYRAGRDDYFQVKYSVDGRTPINSAWWTEKPKGRGQSPLEKFWSSWNLLGKRRPVMTLLTNRSLDPTDPVMACVSGRDGRLMPRLSLGSANSFRGRGRKSWADHLQITEEQLLAMLADVKILASQGPFTHLLQMTSDRHRALGLAHDDNAALAGAGAARTWVAEGRREIDRLGLMTELSRLDLQAGTPQATLLIQEINHDPWPDSATAMVDWVDLFDGDEPRVRRYPTDPGAWDQQMRPDLKRAVALIRQQGYTDVMVRGALRLPSWFACGAELAEVAGFRVTCSQRGHIWTSDGDPSPFDLREDVVELGNGNELAVGLGVTTSIAEDALDYVRRADLPVQAYLDLTPVDGPSDRAIPDASAATGWALAVRSKVRDLVRSTDATKVHLFVASPGGAAFLLGHFWNRVPATQLYADTSPGYVPAYHLPS